MENEKTTVDGNEEYPDSWWYRIYAAVIVFTVFIISALWAFSNYFSN